MLPELCQSFGLWISSQQVILQLIKIHTQEGRPRWDFNIVTQFQILYEICSCRKCLHRVSLENHVSKWVARKEGPRDDLSQNIYSDLESIQKINVDNVAKKSADYIPSVLSSQI